MTVMLRRRLFVGGLAAWLPAAAVMQAEPSRAGATGLEDPISFIAGLGARAIELLRPDVTAAQRIERFRRMFEQDFDMPGIGQFVLGRYRWTATPQQQQEFFALYREYTVRVYGARLGEYGGAPFRVTGSRRSGAEIVVSSEVLLANDHSLHIDWYLAENDGGYKITDVVVAGNSMRIAQRDQFAGWIQNNGGRFDALLAVLRQQLARRG